MSLTYVPELGSEGILKLRITTLICRERLAHQHKRRLLIYTSIEYFVFNFLRKKIVDYGTNPAAQVPAEVPEFEVHSSVVKQTPIRFPAAVLKDNQKGTCFPLFSKSFGSCK